MVSRPPLSPPPFDSQPYRPSFQRSNSSLSTTQGPPKENVVHKAPSMSAFSLKNRPPAFAIPNPLTSIPPSIPSPASQSDHNNHNKLIIPDSPPPLPRKSSSRPSTASSRMSREDVTPWEFQSSPFETATIPINDKFDKAPAPTLKSKTSSIKSKPPSIISAHRQPSLLSRTPSTATGSVEEVTPWELYPPIPEKNTKYHMPKDAIPEYDTPPNGSPLTTITGFVEDVTPWELVPPPPPPLFSSQESLIKSTAQSLSHLSSVETSTLLSVDSVTHHNHKLPSSTPPSTNHSNHSHVSATPSQEHKVLKTGPTEDVTPWELEPGPTRTSTLNDNEETRASPSTRIRSSLTLAQVEEVTPWELHPVPSTPPLDDNTKESKDIGVSTIKKKKGSNSGNTPASKSSKPISDLSFARSRKSGSKSSRSRNTNDSRISTTRQPAQPLAQYAALPYPDQPNDYDNESSRYGHYRAPDLPPTPRGVLKTSIFSSAGAIPSPMTPVAPVLTKPVKSEPTPRSQFNMSTADRKILTQLEHFKDAHDKEFIIKGKGYHQLGGGVTPGKIHHAFDEESVPYPRCYDARAQDLDVWEIMICHQACNSWTWHVFETPPKTVLDIGCGTGSWITHAAGTWKKCQFWGIDLVPTQPDFTTLGDRDLKERVHWVHHNFLEGLPFEAEFFDYIHIKRVGLGVPEDKWDPLFEECRRVLKSGGAFELIEEDLFFPGKPKDPTELPENASKALEGEPEFPTTRESFTSDCPTISQPVSPSVYVHTSSAPLSPRNNHLRDPPATPILNHASLVPTRFPFETHAPITRPTRHNTFTSDQSNRDKDNLTLPHSTTATSSGPQLSVPLSPRSAAKPTLFIRTRSSPQDGATFPSSAVSLKDTLGHHKDSPNDHANASARPRSSGTVASPRDPPEVRSRRSSSHGTQSQVSVDSAPTQNGDRAISGGPLPAKRNEAPRNPRDHTTLETIYTEMLAARFINSTPLSILQNYLEYHFTDVRTHPPLLYTFPSTALLHSESRYVTDSETESVSSDEASSDDEEARDAIRPKPPKLKASKRVASATDIPRSRYRCTLGKPTEDTPSDLRFLSFPHLIRRQSPYISFDRSRGYAFSPTTQVQRRSSDGKPGGPMRMSRLPNHTLNLDLKSLNMHLYLRTMDILGCSEPMWEWVVQYQSKLNNGSGMRTPGSGSLLLPMKSDSSLGSSASSGSNLQVMHGIAEMTRDDFEMLLTNFELDMQDQASVDYALQEQVNWRVFASPRDLRRKAFDDACKKWDKWVATQEKAARRLARSRHRSKAGESNGRGPQSPHNRQPEGGLLFAQPSGTQTGAINGRSPDGSRQRTSLKQDLLKLNSSPSSLPPHKRLSRAFRVYVAWKVRDPQSLNQAVHTFDGFDDAPNTQ